MIELDEKNISLSKNIGCNTWLISDTHFFHLNIIAYTKRPFFKNGYNMNDLENFLSSIGGGKPNRNALEEIVDIGLHNDTIVNDWNAKVNPKDTVYHLGDFGFHVSEEFIKKLNGNIILVKGNHDKGIERYSRCFKYIWEESPLNRGFVINGEKVILCHYPLISWHSSFYGTCHFFGHVHSGPNKKFISSKNSYDVGVDNNEYKILLFEEALEKAKNNKDVFQFEKTLEDLK